MEKDTETSVCEFSTKVWMRFFKALIESLGQGSC
jgi:hypothetical protein